MAEDFGALLRRFRSERGLSQETLAERAQLSPNAVGALERGIRRAPYRETVALLASALALEASERATFKFSAERARSRVRGARSDPSRPLPPEAPVYFTSFVGGDTLLTPLRELVDRHRLVTITGSGGIGKTRAAVELLARLPSSFGDLRFADLSRISDPIHVGDTIASALDGPRDERGDTFEHIIRARSDAPFVLVLDNCEHVIAAAADCTRRLLVACGQARIIVTSRERLGIAGEMVFRVPALRVGDDGEGENAAVATAIALFCDRAALDDARFTLAGGRRRSVAAICRRLEGIPLAIEIAARRVAALGLAGLLDHLQREGTLRAERDRPDRQATMLATVAWSVRLLDERERTVLRRLSIFAAPFLLDAARAVCGAAPVDAQEVTSILLDLVDKSLVEVVDDASGTRYRLLETVRVLQSSALHDAGETGEAHRRLGHWLIERNAMVRAATTRGAPAWLATVWSDFDNVRAALQAALSSFTRSDALLAATIVADYRSMWIQTGRRGELAVWGQQAFDRIDADCEPKLAARVLWALMFARSGVAAQEVGERAIALFDRCADVEGAASVRGQLGYEYCRAGRYDSAEHALRIAAETLERVPPRAPGLYAGVLRLRAWVAGVSGKVDEAYATIDRAIAIVTRNDDALSLLQMHACLAEIHFAAGEIVQAMAIAEDVLARALVRREAARIAIEALCNLASFRLALGERDGAGAAARGALTRAEGRYPTLTHWAIQHLAACLALDGEVSRPARLSGFVDAWMRASGFVRHPVEQTSARIIADRLSRHDPVGVAALRAQGETLTFDQAAAEALAAPDIAEAVNP